MFLTCSVPVTLPVNGSPIVIAVTCCLPLLLPRLYAEKSRVFITANYALRGVSLSVLLYDHFFVSLLFLGDTFVLLSLVEIVVRYVWNR